MNRDSNGEGKWSAASIAERYRVYCGVLKEAHEELVVEFVREGEVTWVYPLMFTVIRLANLGDRAAIALALELIEENQHFPYGSILKTHAARALRRADLTDEQIERIRSRIVEMMAKGMVPREFREYAKLLRRIGMGNWWQRLEESVPRDNRFVMRWNQYFRKHLRLGEGE